MFPIAFQNQPQDAGQLLAFINQLIANLNNFGPGVFASTFATTGNGADTTADQLALYSLPANVMNLAGRGIRYKAWGATANNTDTKTLGLKLGGGSVSLTQALTASSAAAWESEAIILSAGPSLQRVFWSVKHGAAVLGTAQSTGGTEVSTAPIPLLLTGQASVANANDITMTGAVLEFLQ